MEELTLTASHFVGAQVCVDAVHLDSCRGQTADEGDAIEAHSPEEGGAGRLHHKVLQENPQLCEQGPEKGRTTKLDDQSSDFNPTHASK